MPRKSQENMLKIMLVYTNIIKNIGHEKNLEIKYKNYKF